MTGSYNHCMFNLKTNLFSKGVVIYTFPQKCVRVPVSPYSHQCLVIIIFLNLAVLIVVMVSQYVCACVCLFCC